MSKTNQISADKLHVDHVIDERYRIVNVDHSSDTVTCMVQDLFSPVYFTARSYGSRDLVTVNVQPDTKVLVKRKPATKAAVSKTVKKPAKRSTKR